MDAAYLAEQSGMNTPVSVNLAALARSMPADHVLVHEVGPELSRLVADTDLHKLPPSPPQLLREGWCVQARKPERGRTLFGDTVCLGVYPVDGTFFLVGLTGAGAALVGKWSPDWTERDVAEGVQLEEQHAFLEGMRATEHREWTRAAARFALVLAILSEAEGSPLRWSPSPKPGPSTWKETAPVHATVTQPAADLVAGLTPEQRDLIAAQVMVRGHLKTQRYGPGNALSKWIYVQSYAARRWVAP